MRRVAGTTRREDGLRTVESTAVAFRRSGVGRVVCRTEPSSVIPTVAVGLQISPIATFPRRGIGVVSESVTVGVDGDGQLMRAHERLDRAIETSPIEDIERHRPNSQRDETDRAPHPHVIPMQPPVGVCVHVIAARTATSEIGSSTNGIGTRLTIPFIA